MYTYAEVYKMTRNNPEARVPLRLRIIRDLESGKRIREEHPMAFSEENAMGTPKSNFSNGVPTQVSPKLAWGGGALVATLSGRR